MSINSGQLGITPDDINIWCSVAVVLFLISIVALFGIKWRHDAIPIMQVLNILLINEILYSASQVIGYVDRNDNVLCTISIIGRMAFSVAANFWIVFITRLIYREALAPGKYFNLVQFVLRNIIYTYIPSLILSAFLLIIISINQTKSQTKCYQIITQTQFLDYIIYGTTFIIPNLAASLIIIGYLFFLYRLASSRWTFFLLFSITALVFSTYFMAIKIYQFTHENQQMGYYNIAMLLEPIIYGVYFIIVYIRQRKRSVSSSDITIKDSDGQASFIEDL